MIIRRCFFGWTPEKFSHKTVLHFSKSPIVAYNIVADMSSYAEFVPWVTKCKAHHKSATSAEVDMTIGFPPIVQSYISKVTLSYPIKLVSVSSKNSVFETLESTWEFFPEKSELGHEGDVVKITKTEAHYSVRFTFSNPIYQNLSQLVFSKICHETAVAFTKRINAVSGNIDCLYDKQTHKFLVEGRTDV